MKIEKFYCDGGEPAKKPYHYKECGLDNIYLMNGFEIEEVDGDEYVSIKAIDSLWKAIGLSLTTSKKILSPKEIRFLRGQMDKTQAEVAALLRVDDQTVARWEKGKAKLSGTSDIAFRLLFLACPVAQPEGKKLLTKWVETVQNMVERDAPMSDSIRFTKTNQHWEMEHRYAVA